MKLNRKTYIGLLILMYFAFEGNAQQLPIYSQYILNAYMFNPAIAGHDGYTSVNTTARQQWIGMGGAPQTFSASWQTRLLQRSYKVVSHPVRNKNLLLPSTKGRVGLGGYIINDANGSLSRTGVQFSYSYHIIMNNHQLSFGLATKMFQYRISDLTFSIDDPLMPKGAQEVGYSPDIDLGLYWTNTYYYIGASVSNVLESIMTFGSVVLDYEIERHYWVMGGYKFKASSNLEIEPNFLMKTSEDIIPQADIGVKAYYMEDVWGGLTFRTDKSVIALLGMRSKSLHIGYAFDFSLTSIQRFNFGTHELALSYKFGNNARRYRWLRRY